MGMEDPKTQPIVPIKVLVVDDHPNTANTLARSIAQLGHRVQVASATSGHQALQYVSQHDVDILLTDMIMPEMTGLELIEKLQAHPTGRRPTFSYLITAYDVPGLKVSARRLKVKDVIIKPVHPERICQIVLQAIDEMDHARPVVNESTNPQPFTILIADDQPDNVMLLSRYLQKEGYSYIKAKDGVETLEKTRNYMPDLVLLDVNMPNKDGFTVLEEIRADPEIQHIPVIILTAARLEPMEIQSGLNMGADDYITKPFDRKELLARIRTKLRVKQVEDVIRRRNRELNLLPEIGKDLSARMNMEELSTILLKRTGETLGAMLSHLVILNPNGLVQRTYYFDKIIPSDHPSEYSIPAKLLEIANETRQGFIIDDTLHDERWVADENDPVRSVVIVPMFGRHHLLGLLLLANEQTQYFKLEHLLLLQAICSQASIAIENAQLYEKMAQEQQRLTAVLQGAADAILMFDVKNRLSLVNPAGQKLFTDYEMKIGQELTRGKGYENLIAALDQMRRTNASFSGEIAWPDKRVFSAALTPVKEGGCVVVLHDVTHFKNLEKVKNEFIATASHDLRNPITSIKGFSILIKKAGPLNEIQEDFADRIHRATDSMGELVENMLDLAKSDLGVEPKRESVDISELLLNLVDEFKPQAQAKGQSLSIEQTATRSQVQGDAMQLRQAFRNLIGNAIKYTPAGGAITVSIEEKAGSIQICIQDNGYGIPASDLPFIFNRFYRVRNNGHDDIEGNGLGLAIVKSIVEQHGGTVSVQSELGKGSQFTISFSLLANEELSIGAAFAHA